MNNFKFYTNRQVALQMAIEYRKGKVDNSPNTVMLQADEFYEWLQNAPMKDEDQKQWLTDPIIKTKK
jgi:hypothetical protein